MYRRMRETGVMSSGEEAPEGTAEEEDPETPEAAMDANSVENANR